MKFKIEKKLEVGILPLDFFFSWSYMITTSMTFPYREKNVLKSVSVTFEGNPPKKTLG